jgi:phenylacetate-CoA ligase
LRHQPATSDLLGKRSLCLRYEGDWVTPRQVLEALEELDAVPLPARCGFWAVPDGVAVEVVVRQAGPRTQQSVMASLETHEVPVRELTLLTDPAALRQPYPWRGDLREQGFVAGRVG